MRVLLALGAALVAVNAAVQPHAPVVQSFDVAVPFAPTVADMGGVRHLSYEIHLTNFASRPIRIERIEVLNEGGETFAGAEGETLDGWIERAGARDTADARLVPPGARIVVYLDLPAAGQIPAALGHRIGFRFAEGDAGPHSLIAPNVTVTRRPPTRLGPPLRGGPWVAVYAPRMARGHRRFPYATAGAVRVPGRFAIDWFGVDAGGRSGGGERLDQFVGHDAEVLAVADGTVVAVRDDMPEAATLASLPAVSLGDATGNYVAIDIGEGRYAFYEHLRPGILVRIGERVRRGQPIARLGLTGQGSSPHLHFHLADANSPLAADGLPFVIDQVEILGGYPSIEAFAGGGPWNAEERGSDREAPLRPAPNAVVRFPGTR